MFVVGRGREDEAGLEREEGEGEEEREREMSVVFVWWGEEGGKGGRDSGVREGMGDKER